MTELPSGVNINNLISDLRLFSWEAFEILSYYYQIVKDPNKNSNILENDNSQDPVTLADLKVNEIIIQRINEKYKNVDWDILSEENFKIETANFDNNSNWLWILDPLDGTKDFIQGTGNYAMHLALNYRQKPFLGLVLIPEKGELWISNGEKVWSETRDNFQKIPRLYEKKCLNEMILVTSKNHRNNTLKNLIDKINFKEVIVMGSIGCKIASILRGDSDIYICLTLPGQSSPKDWDFAAPEAILRAAGGAITNIDNEELKYGRSNYEQKGIIIASNNLEGHANLCQQIKDIIIRHDLYPFDN